MADKKKIKAFVQGVLGCGCAEEVFQQIDLSHAQLAGAKYDRINIGNRLLIYVFRTDDAQFVEGELSRIIRAGKAERDAKGFNRFRLVLATDEARVSGPAMKAYKKLDFLDDRIYLHVVGTGQVSF